MLDQKSKPGLLQAGTGTHNASGTGPRPSPRAMRGRLDAPQATLHSHGPPINRGDDLKKMRIAQDWQEK